MQILVNMGVVIDAETIKEAIAKVEPPEGTLVSLNANPRPVAPQVQGIQRTTLQPGMQLLTPAHLQPKGQ